MNKLYILVGISGSGKSTWAKQKWEENPLNTIIVSRDKIRELLFGYTEETIVNYYSRPDMFKLEKKVTEFEDLLIRTGIMSNNNIIVDATHLKKEYLNRYKDLPITKEIIYFDIDVEEAINRDFNRNRSVGGDIITKQFENYKKLDKTFQYDKV